MPIPDDAETLAALFDRLGARDPRAWARSQVEEGIPQLHRFLFLRQAWSRVLDADDTRWIQDAIADADDRPDGPDAGVGAALRRCVETGVSPRDLTVVARGLQAELLFRLCYLLDDPDLDEEELEDVAWGLFAVDDEGRPVPPRIAGLHASVLGTDPKGRDAAPPESGA
jgi:hypothetical protein